ncbi:lycopene cyclase domain-containing protein [Yimella sp. cx-573]|nr:lycopene cyclase domain-containing protein [Yimella sp. cx-573]
MSYTALAAIGVVVVLVLDLWVARTRVITTAVWWISYAIIAFFQVLTNGWLTGRRIVNYNPDVIIGSEKVTMLGDGRIGYAPVEDLAFGFGLVLLTCVVWTWLGRRDQAQR